MLSLSRLSSTRPLLPPVVPFALPQHRSSVFTSSILYKVFPGASLPSKPLEGRVNANGLFPIFANSVFSNLQNSSRLVVSPKDHLKNALDGVHKDYSTEEKLSAIEALVDIVGHVKGFSAMRHHLSYILSQDRDFSQLEIQSEIEVLHRLIECGAGTEEGEKDKWTLHRVLAHPKNSAMKTAIINALLEYPQQFLVNEYDDFCDSPLAYAMQHALKYPDSRKEALDILKALCDNGAKFISHQYETPWALLEIENVVVLPEICNYTLMHLYASPPNILDKHEAKLPTSATEMAQLALAKSGITAFLNRYKL